MSQLVYEISPDSSPISQSNSQKRYTTFEAPNLFDSVSPKKNQKSQFESSMNYNSHTSNIWRTEKENFNYTQNTRNTPQSINKHIMTDCSKRLKSQPSKQLNTSQSRISKDLIELDLPQLVQQILIKRQRASSISKPEISKFKGCIVKQIDTGFRQPGKIVSQKQYISVAQRRI